MLTPQQDTAVSTHAQTEAVPGQTTRNRHPLGHLRRLLVPPRTISPLHVVAGLWAGGVVWFCTGPVNDLDSYWHVLIGREILNRQTVDGLGTAWLGTPAPPWRTSQWLAEVGMTQAVQSWGWRGLIVVRVSLVIITLAVVARTLLPGRPAAVTVPVFLATTYSLISVTQDRPQTVSILGIALLSAACARLLAGRTRPPWPVVAVGCLIWAQLHPLWIIAPVAFALVGIVSLLDGLGDRDRLRGAAGCTLASLTGLLSPQGVDAFLLPFRFRAATGTIREWQPTILTTDFTLAWAALIVLTLVAWARTPGRIPRSELAWAIVWWAFGAVAVRDVVPSALLTAPIAVLALHRAWGAALARRYPRSGPREARLLTLATALAVLPGLVLGAQYLARLDPLHDTPALSIARYLARQPEQPLRVFNAYDASGALAAFSAGRARLAVDGRADMWGSQHVQRVVDAQSLRGEWQQVVDDFRPDAFVLRANAPLAVLLQREGRWQVAARDDGFLLLLPRPAAS